MNREIEFRGYNPKNGKWLYGYYLVNRGKHYIVQDGIQPPSATPEDFEVEPESIGQYTGLQDRNGKRIYEGDILRLSDRDGNQEVVVVEHGHYGWTFYNPRTAVFQSDGSHTCRAVENFRFVFGSGIIIGNVRDNPELAKTEEQ